MGLLKFIESVCVQTALYWEPTGTDAYGRITFADPVEVKVRWDDTVETISTNDGDQIISKAQILTPIELKYKGWLLLGHLADYDGEDISDPKVVEQAYEIRRTDTNPLFQSTDEFVRQVWL